MADEQTKTVGEPPVARIVSPKEREKMVPLEYPVEFDGKLYTEIRVHRVTGKEVETYMNLVRSGNSSAVAPMVDCPQEVWDAMDDDDQEAVDRAARPFFPRRLIAAYGLAEEMLSTQDPGENTSG
jgi:hypothetical protein